jgi:hypothetical protein
MNPIILYLADGTSFFVGLAIAGQRGMAAALCGHGTAETAE